MKATLLIKLLSETSKPEIMNLLLKALFTNKEIKELENRIKIFQLLLKGKKQREISEILNVGIATVTRGASALETKIFLKLIVKLSKYLKQIKLI